MGKDKSVVLGLVHLDFVRFLILYQEEERNKYFITLTDGASRFKQVYLLKTKDEAFEKFKYYKVELENTQNLKLEAQRTYCEDECMDLEFMLF